MNMNFRIVILSASKYFLSAQWVEKFQFTKALLNKISYIKLLNTICYVFDTYRRIQVAGVSGHFISFILFLKVDFLNIRLQYHINYENVNRLKANIRKQDFLKTPENMLVTSSKYYVTRCISWKYTICGFFHGYNLYNS